MSLNPASEVGTNRGTLVRVNKDPAAYVMLGFRLEIFGLALRPKGLLALPAAAWYLTVYGLRVFPDFLTMTAMTFP